MNADEASKCLEISKNKYRTGSHEQALKYAHKAIKLHSTPEAEDWLKFLETAPKKKPAATTSARAAPRTGMFNFHYSI